MSSPIDAIVAVAQRTPTPPDGPLDLERLRAAAATARASAPAPIGELAIEVDGRLVPSFYAAVADPSCTFGTLALTLTTTPTARQGAFLTPFTRLELDGSGRIVAHRRSSPPEPGLARWLPREAVGPTTDERRTRLPTLGAFVAELRRGGPWPLVAALEVYRTTRRDRYEIDLLEGRLLADPRAARFRPASRIAWSSRAAWSLDRLIARAHLTPGAARLVERIAEIEPSARAEGEGAENDPAAVEAVALLRQRELIEPDPSTKAWRFRQEALAPPPAGPAAPGPAGPTEPPAAPPVPSGPDAGARRASGGPEELRANMRALLAQAEARSTCPVCGEGFPPGPHGLLCTRCDREVLGQGVPS